MCTLNALVQSLSSCWKHDLVKCSLVNGLRNRLSISYVSEEALDHEYKISFFSFLFFYLFFIYLVWFSFIPMSLQPLETHGLYWRFPPPNRSSATATGMCAAEESTRQKRGVKGPAEWMLRTNHRAFSWDGNSIRSVAFFFFFFFLFLIFLFSSFL